MPDIETVHRAQEDAREGKSASTQAGEFVRTEIDHIREGKHGARSTKQAIAIGLSEARRAGVDIPPGKGSSERTREQAERDIAKGQSDDRHVSAKRSRATLNALKREGRSAASHGALAKQARSSARRRSASERSASAEEGARTKGVAGRSAAAKKAAVTRRRRGAAKKAAVTRKRRVAGKKAARTRGRRGAARKAAQTRARRK